MIAKKHNEPNTGFRFLEPLILVVFWLLLFASPILLGEFENGIFWPQVFRVWRSFIPYLLIFLLNWFILLPFFFLKNKKWIFLAINFLIIGIFAIVLKPMNKIPIRQGERSEIRQEIPRGERIGPPPPRRGIEAGRENLPPKHRMPHRKGLPFYLSFIVVSILMVGFETGLVVTFRWMESERKRHKTEKENVSNQLAFLRNQVSPHFFMNTLNNIHSLVDIDQEKAKDTIIRLSKLMRHLLYDADINKVPLEKELDFVSNYTELMRLRFGKHVRIELNFPEDVKGIQLPPLLFTSFIENAFKYGVSASKASFVKIDYYLKDSKLEFQVENTLFPKEEDVSSTGIGISNVRKRLDLLYGDQYVLKIEENEFSHLVKLTLPL